MPTTASARPPRYGPTSRQARFLRMETSGAAANDGTARRSKTNARFNMARIFTTNSKRPRAPWRFVLLQVRQLVGKAEMHVEFPIDIAEELAVIGMVRRTEPMLSEQSNAARRRRHGDY